jgi:hypothetical protein
MDKTLWQGECGDCDWVGSLVDATDDLGCPECGGVIDNVYPAEQQSEKP